MAIEWHEASTKFKITWFCGLIGVPVLSVIIWRLQIPYIEVYLVIVAIAAWTAAILYKRRKKIMAVGHLSDANQEQSSKRKQRCTHRVTEVEDLER